MAFYIICDVKSVQSVHADEQHMLNFTFAEFVGGCLRGQCAAEKSNAQGHCGNALIHKCLLTMGTIGNECRARA
jgi:hypothetical protein